MNSKSDEGRRAKPWGFIACSVEGGLANRLRAMAGFAALAELHRIPLLVHWEPTDACQAAFDDLFLSTSWDGLQLIVGDEFRRLQVDSPEAAHRSHHTFEKIWFDHARSLCPKEAFTEASARYLRSLQPLPEFVQLADQLAEDLSLSSRVGIHVRMTDNIQAYDEWARTSTNFDRSRISLKSGFLALVRDLDAQGQKMFLCTDNLDIRNQIIGLSRQVASHEAHYDDRGYKLHVDWHYRGNPLWSRVTRRIQRAMGRPTPTSWRTTSIADAWMDMLLLGRCHRIVGTYWSSFGQVAAVRGDVHFSCMEAEQVVADNSVNVLLSANATPHGGSPAPDSDLAPEKRAP